MGRSLFVLSIAANAALLSFLVVAVIATYWVEPGEPQIGLGILWFITLPGIVLVSLACLGLYGLYTAPPSNLPPFLLFVIIVVFVALVGPVVGFVGFAALQRLGAV